MAKRVPGYRLHKTGQATVRIDGKDYYLGLHGTAASRAKYARLIAERDGPVLPAESSSARSMIVDRTVLEIVDEFLTHAETYYRDRAGEPTGEADNLRDALGKAVELYGDVRGIDFGPVALEAVRRKMIDAGLARSTVNARVHRIRRCFRWAASKELIPASVVQALDTLPALAKHRTTAVESPPIEPVNLADVEATLPHLPRAVVGMVRLQLFTGCRAGEIMRMRSCDLDRTGDVWEYRPASHKGSWRGKKRVIVLGPLAQAVVTEFLKADPTAYLFAPSGADRRHKEHYDRRSYRQAIVRAARRAGVASWTPLQLRHAAATTIRARYGLEAAQVMLGHAKADVTEIYAERDLAKAREVVREIG